MPELAQKGETYTPVSGQDGGISPAEKKNIFDKFKGINQIFIAVIVVLAVAVVTMLFMVAGFLLDAWHFNAAVYKEYSEKTASVETTQKINEVLLEQVRDLLEQNKQYREVITRLLNK